MGLYRQYKLVKIVDKRIDETMLMIINRNPAKKGITESELITDFQNSKRLFFWKVGIPTAVKTYGAAKANKFLKPNPQHHDQVIITRNKGGGSDLIEGYGWGLLREIIAKEWKFISILFIVIGYFIGKSTR